jgi:hypothetical protein
VREKGSRRWIRGDAVVDAATSGVKDFFENDSSRGFPKGSWEKEALVDSTEY